MNLNDTPVNPRMKRKNATGTIMKKEFNRFFKDRSLFFTVVIMPGLLIYLIYSMMGDKMGKQFQEDTSVVTSVYVENMPAEMLPLFDSLNYLIITEGFDAAYVREQLRNKDNDMVLVSFPDHFWQKVSQGDDGSRDIASSGESPRNKISQGDSLPAVPNVEIFYNSSSPNSNAAYFNLNAMLNAFESTLCTPCNMFDVNAGVDASGESVSYDEGSVTDELGSVFGMILPMLIIMLLFSACMSVAPTSIAGEKERGTIATLLVTPMPRNQLAMGKVISLSCIALLSGISSFLGIILSLPQMIQGKGEETELLKSASTSLYTFSDYAMLLLIILSTVLLLIGITSIISAWAKSVKSAQTMTLPLMILVMAMSFTPMFGDAPTAVTPFLLPFYNSVQCMAAVFTRDVSLMPFFATVISNIVYTGVTVVLLTKMFNSERVMFGK